MKEEVAKILQEALRRYDLPLGLTDLAATVGPVPPGLSGDASTSIALSVAQRLKRKPRDVADEIRAGLASSMVAQTEIAGPGFINISFSGSWLLDQLRVLLHRREAAAWCTGSRERILLEFVSANPNGPLHVGHGRGAALGDSLARILRNLGHEVQTEYYVNDVGNQMQNLGASVMGRCRELKPDFLDDAETAAVSGWNSADLYRGDYLKDVAREVLEKFPGADRPRGVDFFRKLGIGYMLQSIQRDLTAFRVGIDSWFAESELYAKGLVDSALDRLRGEGTLKEEDGALWFLSTKFGDDKDRVIKRKDERPTYFASDIAYHGYKFERGFERLVDIWGTDHHGYVKRVKSAVQALGRDPDRLTVVLYQLVSLVRDGKPVAMSTRSGEFVTLREVIDEVGTDACRFFFALRGPNSQLEFDLDLAKKQVPENPVFYVQYVHARCCALFREAEKRGVFKGPGGPPASPDFPATAVLEPAERALLIRLASYPDVVEMCGRDLSPHHLTAFLLALAGDYHRFYENCRVLGDPGETTAPAGRPLGTPASASGSVTAPAGNAVGERPAGERPTAFRLALVDGVRTVIRNGLSLLGVSAPESM